MRSASMQRIFGFLLCFGVLGTPGRSETTGNRPPTLPGQRTDASALGEVFLHEVWGRNRTDLLDSCLAPNYFVSTPGNRIADLRDRSWMRAQLDACHTLLPDLRVEILELLENEEKIAIRWEATGSLNFPAIRVHRRKITFAGATLLVFRDHRIVGIWYLFDRAPLFRELGIQRTPPTAAVRRQGQSGHRARGTSCIAGEVLGEPDGHPLGWAHIEIVGADLPFDRLARSDGRFLLCDVVPGVHALKAYLVGYHPQTLQDVLVLSGRTTKAQFQLCRGTSGTAGKDGGLEGAPDAEIPGLTLVTGSEWSSAAIPVPRSPHIVITVVDSLLRCIAAGWDSATSVCVDRYLAPSFTHRSADWPEPGRDRVAMQQGLASLGSVFRISPLQVSETVASGEHAAVRWRLVGKVQNEFCGIEAPGREVDFEGITFVRLEGDRILDAWSLFDRTTLMRQLGCLWARRAPGDTRPPAAPR